MIRRDYILSMIRELVQVLARVMILKERSCYAEGIAELDTLLGQLRGSPLTEPPEVEEWIRLCREGAGEPAARLEAMADAWRERGELLALEQRALVAHHSHAVALGLYLERVNQGIVTRELLDQIGECLAQTDQGPLPASVLSRLAAYYEARGWFSRAEDTYFEWLECGDPDALNHALVFYQRLRCLTEADLKAGHLSQAEIEAGEADLRRRSRELFE